MKAVILAAGKGSRLYPITKEKPKCLVEVNNEPILKHQINNLMDCGINDIIVVGGYKKDLVYKLCYNYGVQMIYNKKYRTTNNMYSLSLSENLLNGKFLLLNGDVVFEKSIIKKMLKIPSDNLIAVDKDLYNNESMKVSLYESDSRISDISKEITATKAYGCSIDIYQFSDKAKDSLFNKINEYIFRKQINLWTEVAIKDIMVKEKFIPCNVNGLKWIEIDTHDDLALAQSTFK